MGVADLIPSSAVRIAQGLAFAALRAPGWGLADFNFLGKVMRAYDIGLDMAYRVLRQLDADWPPSQDASTSALRRAADVFGLSNGAGGFGFRVPQPATGATGVLTGTGGVTVDPALVPPPGTLTGPDGTTKYVLRDTVTLSGTAPGFGQVSGTFNAVTPGSIGNLSPGVSLTWDATPAGLDSAVVIVSGTNTSGKDEEDPADAQRRLAVKLQLPAKGGAPQDYAHGAEAWCENALDSRGNIIPGIRAYGYSGGATMAGGGYDGVGAVMVVITRAGSGLGRLPTSQNLTDISAFVIGSTSRQGQRPIAHSFRPIAPMMSAAVTGLTIMARAVPSRPDLAFHWVRGTTAYTVDSWDGVSKLTLTGLAPADLKTKITNGQLPTLFVDTRSGGLPVGPVIPPLAECVSFADAAGKTTLTLKLPLPSTWRAPSAGDAVYSGQPTICDPATGAGASVVSYVDGLGSSRVSGLYDPFDFWDDVCSVSGVDAAVKSVLWTDGITPLVSRTIANSTLIGVGSGTPSVQDVQPPDNSTLGPGMWFATRVIISD